MNQSKRSALGMAQVSVKITDHVVLTCWIIISRYDQYDVELQQASPPPALPDCRV